MNFKDVTPEEFEEARKQIALFQMETSVSAFSNACQLEQRQKLDAALKQVMAASLAALTAREFNPKIEAHLDPLLKTISPKLCAQFDEYVELAARVWPLIRERCLKIYMAGDHPGPLISDN